MPTRGCALASVPDNAVDLLRPAARSMHRILQVARIIAELAGSADILGPHVAEAIGYRQVSGHSPHGRHAFTQRP
jgi:predicted ATPase with chaperone activity